ncbi:hypothetical protein Halru_2551 [Halovivax ruber XH-70]|uniref:Uncharacterized protein n=2 Tax=Halovivax TaxID=332951 RepID=L0IGL6_HALRX|nr:MULTISPECIES: hypothetical protein [Halovivax]AGB17132.1 hypothetical protein Halru_2551 [Halovivax ruber XH-70]ELZ09495.1 hypothetical protein C479_11775 [Halovivax asiaticus JCM 14624]
MSNRRRLKRLLTRKLQEAGRQYESLRRSTDDQLAEARESYQHARNARGIPSDEEGRAKIVCRRHTERRAALLDEEFRPACFEAGHPDCEGCAEDVRAGRIETW